MLRVTIDIIPFGDESQKRTLRHMDIINIGGSPSDVTGNYRIIFYGERGNAYKRTKVQGHQRKALGPWNLVRKAITALNAPSE